MGSNTKGRPEMPKEDKQGVNRELYEVSTGQIGNEIGKVVCVMQVPMGPDFIIDDKAKGKPYNVAPNGSLETYATAYSDGHEEIVDDRNEGQSI